MMVLHAVATESFADLFRVSALARVGWCANICERVVSDRTRSEPGERVGERGGGERRESTAVREAE